ncbi:Nucleic acid-OB-fold [Cordyceps militaris]|uniref:Nucleic acid-OB-fold n=1 Tax=Cordyceps militaris TaxID=73501 RepID=A0A2H4S7J0_CORMI|nr:Nucleic acid-OB-fold [Cordyceps militaris]
MPRRIILLTGAPSPSDLDQEDAYTVQFFDEPFHELIEAGNFGHERHHKSSPSIAPWRSIPLHRKPLHTGLTQSYSFLVNSFHGHHQHNDFFSPSSLASSYDGCDATRVEQDEAELTEFCEKSLAIHTSLTCSPLGNEDEDMTTTFFDETSFLSSSTGSHGARGHRPPAPNIPPAHLSDLEDVPSAKQVLSLQPQTITLNIIAGILSISQPRSVTTRWGTTLSLVEVLLGDDTRSGFAVTFWLSGEAVAGSDLLSLRRQDVVLLQNVALHVFRGKVYGQSLRRGQTRVHLLWSKRKEGNACYSSRALAACTAKEGAENPQVVKTRAVRDWIIQYVGTDPEIKSLNNRNVWDRPPQDTQ